MRVFANIREQPLYVRLVLSSVLGVTLCFVVLWLGTWILFRGWNDKPSVFLDYRPSTFQARAAEPFFYSLKGSLRHSQEITVSDPVLLNAVGTRFLVSPDHHFIAIVTGKELWIVHESGAKEFVGTVESIYKEPAPIGTTFFRDSSFQWAPDSQSLYVIRDTFYDKERPQLYSREGELWRFDVNSRALKAVVESFPAYDYCFGKKWIYYSLPTAQGDLQLRYFDGRNVRNVGQPNQRMSVTELQTDFAEDIFYSFDDWDYGILSNSAKPSIQKSFGKDLLTYEAGGQKIFSISRGENFKGGYFCGGTDTIRYLAGQRFAIWNGRGCEPHDVSLLIDAELHRYEEIPSETFIYQTFNTNDTSRFIISGAGIKAQ